MYCLLEVVSVFPEKLAPRFADKIDWIRVSTVFMLLYPVQHVTISPLMVIVLQNKDSNAYVVTQSYEL